MKRLFALILLAALALLHAPAHAQTRIYSQAELDALLAPIALHPDGVLSNILVAATQPEDLRDAAAWSRGNPQLAGEDALRAAEPYPWHPSVKSLVAFPEVLARMDESPHWTADLGAAFVTQEPQVMETVQALRRRAQASGYLQSTDQHSVQRHGDAIAVYPAQPHVVYVPYYDPYVVYGPWWWHSYRPVYWRPWHPRPAAFVSFNFVRTSVDWHHRHVHRHHHVQRYNHVQHHPHARPRSAPANHAHNPVHVQPHHNPHDERRDRRWERRTEHSAPPTVHNHAHQAQHARPIVQGAVIPREHRQENRDQNRHAFRGAPAQFNHQPAQHTQHRREHRREDRDEHRNHFRGAPVVQHNNPAHHARPAVREHRQESRGHHRQESRGQHRGHGRNQG